MYLCDIHDITQQYYYLVWAYSKAHHSPRRADQQSTRFWFTEIYIFTLNVEEVQLSYIVSKQQNYSFNLYPLRSLLLRSSLQQRHHQPHFTLSGFRKFGFFFSSKTGRRRHRTFGVLVSFFDSLAMPASKKVRSWKNYPLTLTIYLSETFEMFFFSQVSERNPIEQVFNKLLEDIGEEEEFSLPDWLNEGKPTPYTYIKRSILLTQSYKIWNFGWRFHVLSP